MWSQKHQPPAAAEPLEMLKSWWKMKKNIMQILTHSFTNLGQRQNFSSSVTKFRKTRITPLQNIVYRNFLPHFFFNSDTFWRCDTACWSHGRAKNQVWANQNSGHYDIKLLDELYVNAIMTKEYFENLKITVFRF